MPFSRAAVRIKKKNKKIVTLQVRILKPVTSKYRHSRHDKKAFFPVSASMTLEAVFVLSLFIFAAVSLMIPMKIMTTERKLQAGLEAVGEDFSKYAYIQDALEKGKLISVPGADTFAVGFCKNLSAGIAGGYAQVRATGHSDTGQIRMANMLRSSIREDGETFDLILDYKIQMPFPVLGFRSLSRTVRCTRRAWIGKPGKDNGEGGLWEEEKDEIVYVGRDSTRYHRLRSCHYLSNTLTGVSYDRIGEQRNEAGKKYYACAVCAGSAGPGASVYIMPSGTRFHSSQTCSAIVAYARAVHLSEVEHLGPCSYCSR